MMIKSRTSFSVMVFKFLSTPLYLLNESGRLNLPPSHGRPAEEDLALTDLRRIVEAVELLPTGLSGVRPVDRSTSPNRCKHPETCQARDMAADMSMATSVTTFERPARPRPERKPGGAGLRGGERMRRGDAKPRRAARLTTTANHRPLERAG